MTNTGTQRLYGSGVEADGTCKVYPYTCYFIDDPKEATYGKFSYHFDALLMRDGGSYLSHQKMTGADLLDPAGLTILPRKYFQKLVWNKVTRTLTSELNYMADTTGFTLEVWTHNMVFSDDMHTFTGTLVKTKGITTTTTKYGTDGLMFYILESAALFTQLSGECIEADGTELRYNSFVRDPQYQNSQQCAVGCNLNAACTAWQWDYMCKIITETCGVIASPLKTGTCNLKPGAEQIKCDRSLDSVGACRRYDG